MDIKRDGCLRRIIARKHKRVVVLAGTAALCLRADAVTWRKREGNPVLGNGELGTCFDVNVVTNGPAPYTMYFSWRPKKAIALVRSDDAAKWAQTPETCLYATSKDGVRFVRVRRNAISAARDCRSRSTAGRLRTALMPEGWM